ncbi:MAG TPA: DUF4214 domain-containing protein, partial [Iamia sp.]|nr:DUF4214 domain-containing protein [Iamia sp.]
MAASADATPEDGAERWVRAAVLDLLGRPATDLEVATLSGRIVAGTSRGVIAKELARSREWTASVVTDLYQHILDREPDFAGLEYWIGRLRGGDRVASVAVSIYGSPEYYAEVGGTSGAYVDALYQSVLGRTAEAGGRAYWIDRLDRGTSRWVVARSVFLSAEARGRRVDALYLTLLGRPASAADRAYWAGRLVREDDIVLAAHLVASAEHQARAQTRPETAGYELDPGDPVTVAVTQGNFVADPTVGVSGDGATVVHPRDFYLRADLEAVDVASGGSETIAQLVTTDVLFPRAITSRPSVSDDGRFVTLGETAMWGIHSARLFDRLTGTATQLLPSAPQVFSFNSVISADGST